MDREKLRRWYARYGFEGTLKSMLRKPVQLETVDGQIGVQSCAT